MNFTTAKTVFREYLKDYDPTDGKVRLKITHTYHTVALSEFIARELGLPDEDIQLAKLIALLHDIGRFDQVKRFQRFSDTAAYNHAEAGERLLFGEGFIRDFIAEPDYDGIIAAAVRNHSKYRLGDGLSPRQILHCDIIRDSDKLDNFRGKLVDRFEDIAGMTEWELEDSCVSDGVFDEFMACRQIRLGERKTPLDYWVLVLAFTFDLNFECSLRYVKRKDYIDRLIGRIDYKRPETREQMEKIRECVRGYIDGKTV